MSAIEKAIDLNECAREPIETPGTIQAHGILIAASLPDLSITHASANAAGRLALPKDRLLALRLPDLLGEPAAEAVLAAVGGEGYAPSNVLTLDLPALGGRADILVHRIGDRLCVEIEEADPDGLGEVPLSSAQAIINGLKLASGLDGVCAAAVRDFRALTGYDRVMVYRFDEDGHGSVIAESRDPALEPYLHLRFPASDIPAQARRLCVMQRVRLIVDVDAEPVPLLAAGGDGRLDMTFCSLRTPSPIHCQYVRNMGVRATLSVSLVHDDALWGMIVCHHRTPRHPGAHLRALCELVGQLLSVLAVRAEEAVLLGRRLQREQMVAAIGALLETSRTVVEGLSAAGSRLLGIVDAQGALVRLGGWSTLIGVTPPLEVATAIADRLRAESLGAIAADDGVSGRHADFAPYAASASGALVMPVSNNPADAIVWFRGEQAGEVLWGGDPNKAAQVDPVTGRIGPRTSFAARREVVRGRSAPWTKDDLRVAGQLRRIVTVALLHHAEQRLARFELHDTLTGLANRRALEAALEAWRNEPIEAPASLIAVALDKFALINESYGHAAGDELLRQAAQRLWQEASGAGLVARIGDDGFAVFCHAVDSAAAQGLAQDILEALRQPFDVAGQWHRTTASLGVASSESADRDLLREADAAANASKRTGGDRCTHYDPGHHEAVLNYLRNQQDLYLALEREELLIHFQPVVTADTLALRGFEALVRWRHPVRGAVPPSEFIPVAEEMGLIHAVGAFVLHGALAQVATWRDRRPNLLVAVNASVRELLRGDYAATVRRLLEEFGVAASHLCVEVTESVMMQEGAVRELEALRALGVLVALDDFGTGYSSLSALQALPIDKVKIDRGFLAAASGDAKAAAYFSAVARLGQTLNIVVTAEGVETAEQLQLVRDAGCHAAQGYLFSPALDVAAATASLDTLYSVA